MRTYADIEYIVLHCTATRLDAKVPDILRYWRDTKGWGETPGYNVLIEQDGTIWRLRDWLIPTFGVKGFNQKSVHICTVGGLATDDRTEAQKARILEMLTEAKQLMPQARIVGHNDLNPQKACPRYDAKIYNALWQ